MFKKTYSFNKDIEKMQSNSLTRSKNLSASLPDNLSRIFINIQNQPLIYTIANPRLRKVNPQEAQNIVKQLYDSIYKDGWLNHIENTSRLWRDIENKEVKTETDRWNLRCCVTEHILRLMKKEFNKQERNPEKYIYFACDIQTIPFGVMKLKCKPNDLEISYIVTHPGVEKCSYFLMEKAVNQSCKMGFKGKLRLITATDDLYDVYHKMGFINNGDYMTLEPEKSNFWFLSPINEEYHFKRFP
ncbi:hypothetical protein PSI19_05705 [Xenorhabdus khoisanae]|uniref:hypothetical protein n=1 Tax=Xenorhabdus khoisanae TaxID=880157 RepID=UPI0023599F21|nr:hypothetical protein [Xenorhabdus khoisanae]MDC9613391.1 hypothetical protein [Xenorhabdus khoisanae]